MTTRLAAQNLEAISAFTTTPRYDRSALTAGIVHFGVGNFHRAHQAVYLGALFNTGRDHGWAIMAAGVLPSDGTNTQSAGKIADMSWKPESIRRFKRKNWYRFTVHLLTCPPTSTIILRYTCITLSCHIPLMLALSATFHVPPTLLLP